MQNSSFAQGALDPLKARAVFRGLVFSEAGDVAQVVALGGVYHYAIPDQGFVWHVEAYRVDDVALDAMQRQFSEVRPQVVDMMLDMLGRRDIFTKAALDASVENLADNVRRGDTAQWATMLGLAGFRIIVDHRGTVLEINFPSQPDEEGD